MFMEDEANIVSDEEKEEKARPTHGGSNWRRKESKLSQGFGRTCHVLHDYFIEESTYSPKDFRQRFRMNM
jgi:hypothetical protein